MVFEKYKARKAYAKELKSYSLSELELEHRKLRNPLPPSYDDLYKDSNNDNDSNDASATTASDHSRDASPHTSADRPVSYSRSTSNASSSSTSTSSSSRRQ